MSRATGQSHVFVVAPDLGQAAGRLAWAWGQELRQAWALDNDRRPTLPEMYLERQELRSSLPPDRSAELDHVRHQLRVVEQDAADLRSGTGRSAHNRAGQAARALTEAATEYRRASQVVERADLGVVYCPIGACPSRSPTSG